MAGPTLAMLEREKAFQVKKMPSEGMSLAEQRERRQGRQGRACLWGKLPGKRRNPTSQESSPGQMKGARRGTGTRSGGTTSAGQGGARGPTSRGPHGARMGGAVRQQVCVTCGARMRRLELARVLGQCRAAPRRRETSLRL